MDRQTITSIFRVLKHVEAGKKRLVNGILFRSVAGCLSICPLALCFYWLYSELRITSDIIVLLQSPSGYLIILVGVFFAQLVCAYLGYSQSFIASSQIIHAYRKRLINHIKMLPLGQINQTPNTEFAKQLNQDIKAVEQGLIHAIPSLIAVLIPTIVGVAILALISPLYTLGVCLGLMSAFYMMLFAKNKLEQIAKEKALSDHQISRTVTDYIEALRVVKLFNQSCHWLARVEKQLRINKHHSLQVGIWQGSPVLAYRIALNMTVVLIVAMLAVTRPEQGVLTIDFEAIIFTLLFMQILFPLYGIDKQLSVLRIAIQSEQKLDALLEEPILTEPAEVHMPKRKSIKFERVSYSNGIDQAIEHVSFYAPENSITAVVGEASGGTSALLKLCSRFVEPDSGHIKIGGIDLKDIGSQGVFSMVSVVCQKVQLIDANVLDNIRIAKPGASNEEVLQACEQANCLEFIDQLPNGAMTQIGDKDIKLSAHQRHRIAIARAWLKDAPIVLFDEATAFFDPIAHNDVACATARLMKNRTVIIVTHHLSNIMHADNILVINEGKLVESGTHRCLLSIGGYYTRLWQAHKRAA
ncbi:ABC transporter ATP-binding protein [Pseudoalteromonas sp. Of7M-16]|uniref:ABC transporter ATP-binding protein n=1 Tax=Pseudoalteromonas sp. Of7M-16 TaxID=2917756 RepID=UPI001EF45466|nr:ABC transporter ATP-binding protein [Pseudoalteromonas sp. Of7M-16]MCG7550741.1 ABC transporter ATP-binding protein/permease [Pseudoalteromonas sp. Of7M-16]